MKNRAVLKSICITGNELLAVQMDSTKRFYFYGTQMIVMAQKLGI